MKNNDVEKCTELSCVLVSRENLRNQLVAFSNFILLRDSRHPFLVFPFSKFWHSIYAGTYLFIVETKFSDTV